MSTCPQCGNILKIFENKKYICINDNCTFNRVLTVNESSNIQLAWFKKLYKDNSFWSKAVFEKYPSIIAHEYYRLFNLLGEGQVYGVLLQIKDVFEVLLKFPTLIALTLIYYKTNRTDEENNLLIESLRKALSLGDWENIAKNSLSILEKDKINNSISMIIKDIIIIFKEKNITNWRNKTIGHGALAFSTDPKFQEDIKEKLLLLKKYLDDMEVTYAKIQFYLLDNNKKILLNGKNQAKNLNFSNTNLYIEIDNLPGQNLYPYILLEDKEIYFFDTYSSEQTAILSYTVGDKKKITINEFINLYKNLSKDKAQQFLISSIDNETYSTLEEEIINKIENIDDYQEPKYLSSWLKNLITNNSKGIYLLEMERGTGKTTFARALDEQSLCKIKLDNNISVRSYYIKATYSHKIENFRTHINDILRQDKNSKLIISGSIPTLNINSKIKKKEFADLLNFFRKEHYNYFNKEKLLLIIDGLDEIPPKNNITIFDFIPPTEMLDEGIYILLTSRTKEELIDFTISKLSNLKITDKATLTRDSKENIDLLTNYVKNYIKIKDKDDINQLLDKSERRFLYLKLFKDLIKIQSLNSIKALPAGKELFKYYLDNLKNIYSEKYFSNIKKLISVISTSFKPLTIKEISYLLGEDKPTFKLLGNLTDLRGMIKIDRNYRGNLISIGHEDLKNFVIDEYEETTKKLIEVWINDNISKDVNKVDINNDGEAYLYTYILNYVKIYLKKEDNRLYNKIFPEVLLSICEKFPYTECYIDRIIHIYNEILNIYLILKNKRIVINDDMLATVYNNRANAYSIIQKIENSISDYTQAIAIGDNIINKKEVVSSNIISGLGMALSNRGVAYMFIQNLEEALVDLTRSIEIQVKLKKLNVYNNIFDENDLVLSLINRGIVFYLLQNIEKSMNDFNQADNILKELEQQKKAVDENNIVMLYTNRGVAYLRLQKTEQAIDELNQALDLVQKLQGQGKLKNENGLIKILANRGAAYYTNKKFEKARKDYNKAIEIGKKLIQEGLLLDVHDLSGAFNNRIVLSREKKQIKEALNDSYELIDILKKLKKHDRLDENLLSEAFINLGHTYKDINHLNEAIDNYTEAINIIKEMKKQKFYVNENDLVKALTSRAGVYSDIQKTNETIRDYNEAIKLGEKLKNQGKLLDIFALGNSFNNRGLLFRSIEKVDKAIDDYNKAIEIYKDIQKQDDVTIKNSLANTYINRAYAYSSKQKIYKAINDYTEGIGIYQILRNNKQLDENDLLNTLINRGNAYSDAEKIKEAISDYTQVIEIGEQLKNEKKSINIGYLGTAYNYRGVAWRQIKELQNSINDCNKAIEIWKLLIKENDLLSKSDLARAYHNRGLCYWELKEIQKAISDYSKAIKIYQNIKEKNNLFDERNSAEVIFHRGMAYKETLEIEKALNDYNQVVEISQRLREKEKLLEKNILTRVYLSRGKIYSDKNKLKEAIKDYTNAIEIWEKIKNIKELLEGNDLATAYNNRGNCYFKIQLLEKALLDYNQAVEIRKKLNNKGKLIRINDLGHAFNYRGYAYMSLAELDKSIKDFEKAHNIIPDMSSYDLACIFSIKGDIDKAFDWLKRNVNSEFKLPKKHLLEDKDLIRLHSDERWNRILESYYPG
jgi:tetratricopeptide (TPR) repeat protein